jgi:hypothetical protein
MLQNLPFSFFLSLLYPFFAKKSTVAEKNQGGSEKKYSLCDFFAKFSLQKGRNII